MIRILLKFTNNLINSLTNSIAIISIINDLISDQIEDLNLIQTGNNNSNKVEIGKSQHCWNEVMINYMRVSQAYYYSNQSQKQSIQSKDEQSSESEWEVNGTRFIKPMRSSCEFNQRIERIQKSIGEYRGEKGSTSIKSILKNTLQKQKSYSKPIHSTKHINQNKQIYQNTIKNSQKQAAQKKSKEKKSRKKSSHQKGDGDRKVLKTSEKTFTNSQNISFHHNNPSNFHKIINKESQLIAKNEQKNNVNQHQTHKQSNYLLMGDDIYFCQKASQLRQLNSQLLQNEKIPKFLKDNDRKQEQIDHIMPTTRLLRKQKSCIRQINKYIKSFLQNIPKNRKIVIENLTEVEKMNLYELLLKESKVKDDESKKCQNEIQTLKKRRNVDGVWQQQEHEINRFLQSNHHNQISSNNLLLDSQLDSEEILISQLIKQAVVSLERKVSKMLEEYPLHSYTIIRWKNDKMHQLQTAKTFLSQKYYYQDQREFQNTNQAFLFNLQQQLQIILHEQFYPQLKYQAQSLRQSIIEHLKQQRYPNLKKQQLINQKTNKRQISHKNVSENQVKRIQFQSEVENIDNYYGVGGIIWLLNTFRQYLKTPKITEKHNQTEEERSEEQWLQERSEEQWLQEIILKINHLQCYDAKQKNQLSKINPSQIHDFLEELSKDQNEKEILSKELYICFEKHVIGIGDSEEEKQAKKSMHIFNKMIIDAVNEQLLMYTPYYPYGEPLLFLQPQRGVYQINQYNFDVVFEKVMWNIYQNAIILVGLILDQEQTPKQHTFNEESHQNNLERERVFQRKEIIEKWNQSEILKPILEFGVYRSLENQIQIALVQEFISEMQEAKMMCLFY